MYDHEMTLQSFERRRLPWSANARDLGGLPAPHGSTRRRSVVRSDFLDSFSDDTIRAMRDYGILRVIDLQTSADRQRQPSPFSESGSPALVNVSFAGLPDSAGPEFTTISNEYRLMAERFREVAATVFETLAGSIGGVLIHCEYGKDRTGFVAALLLDLAGVPREVIGADHEFTACCLKPRFDEFLENGPGTRRERESDLANFLPTAESLLSVFEWIDREFGGTTGYLRTAQVDRTTIKRSISRRTGSK